MEKQNKITSVRDDQPAKGTCNVNSTFNFTVGTIAIAVAGLAGYLIFH